MVRNMMALLVSLLIGWGTAHAQQPAASAPTPDTRFMDIKVQATNLHARIKEMEEKIKEAKDANKGFQLFDEMIGAVKGIHDALADNSRLWAELRSLLGELEEESKVYEDKSLTDPRYKAMVTTAKENITKANTLRDNIIRERASSVTLVQRIEKDKAWFGDKRKERKMEEVLVGLQAVVDELKGLNNGLENLSKEAQALPPPGVAH